MSQNQHPNFSPSCQQIRSRRGLATANADHAFRIQKFQTCWDRGGHLRLLRRGVIDRQVESQKHARLEIEILIFSFDLGANWLIVSSLAWTKNRTQNRTRNMGVCRMCVIKIKITARWRVANQLRIGNASQVASWWKNRPFVLSRIRPAWNR